MHLPTELMSATASDVYTLIWNKERFSEGDENGTESWNRAWICKEVRERRRPVHPQLGAHAKAIQVKS